MESKTDRLKSLIRFDPTVEFTLKRVLASKTWAARIQRQYVTREKYYLIVVFDELGQKLTESDPIYTVDELNDLFDEIGYVFGHEQMTDWHIESSGRHYNSDYDDSVSWPTNDEFDLFFDHIYRAEKEIEFERIFGGF